jgi:sarcosine oxidase
MSRSYDFAIIGAGVFGAWIAYCLRLRGFQVALLDAYGAANSRASSGGETRIIRMGYGPDELYTGWAVRSLARWKEFAAKTDQELFYPTGVLWVSEGTDPYTEPLPTVLRRAGVRCAALTGAKIRQNYPQLSFPAATRGILEPESGVLLARQAVQVLVRECIKLGVTYALASVLPPSGTRKLKAVSTSAGRSFLAANFVFASGPWLPKLFPDLLEKRIRPTRQEVFFLGTPPGDDPFGVPRMPAWLHHTHPSRPYALPDIANRGFKIAFDRHGPAFDPDHDSRIVGEGSIAELRAYLKQHVPSLGDAPVVETRVCQYENTSNGDLLIDRHPEFENVWLVGGGSGHGFKHGPAVGEYLAGLLFDKAPPEPRFSLASKQTIYRRAVF